MTTTLAQAVASFFVRKRDRLVWVHSAMFAAFLAIIAVPLRLAGLAGGTLAGLCWWPAIFGL